MGSAFELSLTNFTATIPAAALERYPSLANHQEISGSFRVRFALSAGGQRFRIRLTNELSVAPLSLCGASVAFSADGANADPASIRRLTFGEQTRASIPAASALISDPVAMPVKALTELLFSVCIDQRFPLQPFNGTTQMRAEGDQVMNAKFQYRRM